MNDISIQTIGGVGLGIIIVLVIVIWLVVKKSPKAPAEGRSDTVLARSLRDEKQKSNIILNYIDDGVILIDSNLIIQSFNQGAAAITGWPTEEALGLELRSVIKLVNQRNEPYTDINDPFVQIFKQENTLRDNDAILVPRSGDNKPISLSISPILGEENTVSAAVAVFRDVSKERQQEEQRADFISTASHEMRTPVAAIEGYLSLALNDKVSSVDSRARAYLDKAYSATKHLGELFQDLLTSAKAEDGRLTNHPVVVELGEFLEHLNDDLKFAAQKKNLFNEFIIGSATNIDASGPAGKVVRPLYYVHVDPDRLREVVTNLFDNGVKYTDAGKITIGLTGNDQVCQIYIRDTGAGIPSEDVGHLFQKFYRVDSSATRTVGGTGLGLFICRKIIELYNGRIWAESELGKGSTFYINLPRLSQDKARELQNKESLQASHSQAAL